jgi:hypothetical protein
LLGEKHSGAVGASLQNPLTYDRDVTGGNETVVLFEETMGEDVLIEVERRRHDIMETVRAQMAAGPLSEEILFEANIRRMEVEEYLYEVEECRLAEIRLAEIMREKRLADEAAAKENHEEVDDEECR